jgi:hypothetical protein
MVKQLFINFTQFGKGDWWIEIITSKPQCIYYFGPFASFHEAEAMRPSYVDDLLEEGVYTLQVLVKQCHPTQLTVFDETEADGVVSIV